MRHLAPLALLALACSCVAPTRLVVWKAKDRVLSVSAGLASNQGGPSVYQQQQAFNIARAKCNGPADIVEEGTDLTSTPYAYVLPTSAAAGEVQSASYYWVMRCEDARKAPAPDDSFIPDPAP